MTSVNWQGVGSSLWKLLKTALKFGAEEGVEIVKAYNPALGVLVERIVDAIVKSESLIGSGDGETKHDLALLLVDASGPELQRLFAAQGKSIENEDLFARGVEQIQEGLVDVLNATGDEVKVSVAD